MYYRSFNAKSMRDLALSSHVLFTRDVTYNQDFLTGGHGLVDKTKQKHSVVYVGEKRSGTRETNICKGQIEVKERSNISMHGENKRIIKDDTIGIHDRHLSFAYARRHFTVTLYGSFEAAGRKISVCSRIHCVHPA